MKLATSFLACALLLGLPTFASAQPASKVAEGDIGKKLKKTFDDMPAKSFSGAVLVAHQGEVIFVDALGMADLRGATELGSQNLFAIASITKPFTAIAAMQLVEQGKLNLDDSISKHLPNVPEDCQSITVRDLLMHTSGMPVNTLSVPAEGLEIAVERLFVSGRQHQPGVKHAYWNPGYMLISEIVAKISGQTYTDYCREHIFEVANMTGTCFNGDPPPTGLSDTIGITANQRPRTALEHPYQVYGLNYRGAGGIVSHVHDMFRFHQAIRDHKLLSEQTTLKMFRPGLKNYAIGWTVDETPWRNYRQHHSGSVRGFAAEFRRYPKTDSCIVVLANWGGPYAGNVADQLEKSLLAPTTPKDGAISVYVGNYDGPRGTVFEIYDNSTFSIKWNNGAPNSDGKIELRDGLFTFTQAGTVVPVKATMDDDEKQVQSLELLNMVFERRD